MKVLLDENLPHDLRHLLSPHEIVTTAYMGWDGIGNGELLALAAADGIDVLVSRDAGIEHEQNLQTLPISVVLLRCKSGKIEDVTPLVPAIILELAALPPKSLVKLP